MIVIVINLHLEIILVSKDHMFQDDLLVDVLMLNLLMDNLTFMLESSLVMLCLLYFLYHILFIISLELEVLCIYFTFSFYLF